jgi:hydroxymethylpyrimidine/phosphomethylpyrimidine kinase
VVLDPVIASTSGYRFAGTKEIAALRTLLAVATIATPNAPEAAELSGMSVRTTDDAERAALALAASSKCAVLVTGGHMRGGDRVVDVLARGRRATRYSARRLARQVRGTGCLLASALAASLARGDDLETAVARARSFVRRAIASARPLGNGRPQFTAGRS